MKKPNSTFQYDEKLRIRAEQLAQSKVSAEQTPKSEADALALVHELQVQQIELELQNVELRRAQIELTTLEARYRELYDFAPVGYLTLNSSDVILEANLAAAALLGTQRSELINRHFPTCLSIDSQVHYRVFVRSLRESGARQMCELSVIAPKGFRRYLQAEAVVTEEADENDRQIRIAILDITERKQVEHVSMESAQQFRSSFENIFEQGPLGIAFVDLNSRFIHSNSQFREMLEYSEEELFLLHVPDVVHSDDIGSSIENRRKQLQGERANNAQETRLIRKHGDTFWSRSLVTLMRDSDKAPLHFLALIEDISEQKVAEQRRLDAIIHERTRIAQDIHDTLAQGFTGILMQLQAAAYAPAQEQARLHISQASALARESLQEARRSVRALRPQALEGSNLPVALAQLVAQIRTENSMKVRFAVHGIPCLLKVDVEDHLYRIGQEALTNAIKHSKAKDILLDLWFEPKQVRLNIQDDGNGFDASAGFQGSGFGLVGMSERAEQIGGVMSLASSPEFGSSITVTVSTIPVMAEKA